MRDTVKSEEYFQKKIQSDKARISKFEELLHQTAPSNENGIRIGKLRLFTLYRDHVKAAYSAGVGWGEIYPDYLRAVSCYRDVCTPADSLFDIIDLLSIGVLCPSSKGDLLPALETIVERSGSQDGLICCLLWYLQDKRSQLPPSRFQYFDRLMKSDDKAKVLSAELPKWYSHHKSAYWYDSHKSRHDTYCGYWCFELAALSKIFGVDDTPFACEPYYPYDLAHSC